MAQLSISKAWDETREVLASDGRLMASVALALVLLPQVIADVLVPVPNLSGEQPPSWTPILTILVALAGLVGQIAIIRLALGPATSVGQAISHGTKRLLPGFGALILFALPLAIILGLLLVAVGGPNVMDGLRSGTPDPAVGRVILLFLLFAVAVSVRFQFMVPVASAEQGGPIHILRRSWELTAGNYWRMLGFLALVLITALVVLLVAQFTGALLAKAMFGDIKPLSVSALVVALITGAVQTLFVVTISTMLARMYVQVAGRGSASVPKSGT